MKIKMVGKLYYLCFFLYIFTNVFTLSMIGYRWLDIIPFYMLNALYICLIGLKIFFSERISYLKLFFWIIGAIVFCLVFLKTGYTLPLLIILFVLGSDKCDSRVIIKIHFITTTTIVVISTILSQFGVIEDRIALDTYKNQARHSMGMTYVTIWAGLVSSIIIDYLLLCRKKRIGYKQIAFISALTIFSYVMSYTRIEFALNVILIICLVFIEKIEKCDSIKRLMIFSFPIATLLMYGIQIIYMSNPIKYEFLNKLSTDRLALGALALEKYPVTLFGTAFRMQGYGTVDYDWSFGYFFIDAMYLNYLLQYGILFVVLLNVIAVYMAYRLYKKNNIILLVLFSLCSIHGMIISSAILPYISIVYLICYVEANDGRISFEQFFSKYRNVRGILWEK